MSKKRPKKTTATSRRELWIDLGLAALLVVLAAVHRIAFLHSNRDREWPYTVFYEGDSETFFLWARAIAKGEIYDSGLPFHPPGFAYLLSSIHDWLGVEPGAAVSAIPHLDVKSTLAWLSALAVGLFYLLLRPYLGRPVALLASLLTLYHFGLYILAVAPVTEGIYLSLLMLALLVWSRFLEHPLAAPGDKPSQKMQRLAGLVLGVLLGFLALTRAESGLVGVLLGCVGLWGCYQRRCFRRENARELIAWGLVVVGFLAALTPWTLHNRGNLQALNERMAPVLAEPLPTFVPLTLYGPMNLALANHEHAKGTFSPNLIASLGLTGKLQLGDPKHLDLLLHGDKKAWEYIRNRPGDFAALVLTKWSIALESLRFGWTQWNIPGGLAGTRRSVDIMAPHTALGAWITAPLILLGFAAAWRLDGAPRRWLGIVILLTGASFFTTALFFGYVRQGLLLVPFWSTGIAILSVYGARFALKKDLTALPDGLSRGGLAVAGAVVLLLLAVELQGAKADRNYEASGTNLPGRNVLNRDLPVELKPLPD